MAMLKLGKLNFEVKDGGMEFCWGDGEPKRIGRKLEGEENYSDGYEDDYAGEEDAGMHYQGRFADDGEYPDDDYDDGYEDYADDQYDDYADDGYEDSYDDGYDEGYDDGYEDSYDEGYDEGYDDSYDDGYDDGYGDYDDEEYDDRYSDEDADDGYGYDDGYADGAMGGLIQYVDENDWVTFLLLVLLPPLGIYLLWRRQRFEPMIRYALTAAGAVWFVVMIVLLAMLMFRGGDDVTDKPVVPTLQPTVAASAAPSPSASATATVAPNSTANLSAGILPSATPIGGAALNNNAVSGNVVWASASGNFYHNNAACTLAAGENLAQTTIENAKNRSKFACPTCYGGSLFYATAGGSHYHLNNKCSDMTGAEMYTKEMAEAEKKTPCPVCVTKTQTSLVQTPGSLSFITANTADKSGIKVWCTAGGKNYHMTSSCRGMSGAKQVSLKDALMMGKTACSTCCEVSGENVYCTKNGTYYHRDDNCSGMTGASKVTIAEALVMGKKECRTCRPVANTSVNSDNKTENSSGSSSEENEEYYVYATKNGQYYHVKKNCTGMSGASKVTLKSMVEQGRPACPECCGGAGMSVYATRGGTYYHSYATCSGMSGAKAGSLSDALAEGYKRCPRCWGESASTGSGATVGSGTDASNATANTVMVYATGNGKWYHTKSNCTGMKGARKITLSQAMDEGKTACSTCATSANTGVYSTNSGKYYHKASSCDGMKGAALRTLAEALKKGQTACPVCLVPATGSVDRENAGNVTEPEKVANFTVGKSGIKVYSSQNHKYFHTKSDCADVELSHVALETALNYGKKACSKCAASAAEKVYATKNGKYYHITRSCAGSGATSGTLANALAYGFGPCPYCVKGEFDENGGSGTYKSGRSGIKVYAKANGKYYHTKKSCADDGSSYVTLETALNYGLKACSKCSAVAERTVYAVKGTNYFHSSKTCAGSNAVKGNYAQALAYGLKACPNCIGGSAAGGEGAEGEMNPTDTPEYTAPADSAVYIDLYADEFYYHKAKKCSESGMSGGEEVTLEYALDFGYQKCPHCNPASGVE